MLIFHIWSDRDLDLLIAKSDHPNFVPKRPKL